MPAEEQAARIPHFDGFIKVDADLVNKLSGALADHGGQPFRYNLEAVKQSDDSGRGLRQVDITYHIQKTIVILAVYHMHLYQLSQNNITKFQLSQCWGLG